jgi:hypothetical protein
MMEMGLMARTALAGMVRSQDRLLAKLDSQGLHLAQGVDRLGHGPTLVGVDAHSHLRPDGAPDSLEAGEILVGIEPDLDLEGLVAHIGVFLGLGGHIFERIDARRDVGLEDVLSPAEETEKRQPGDLAQDVVEGHVEGGDHARIGVDEGPDLAQERVDRQRVLAGDHVADGLGRGDVRGLGFPGDGREGTRLADTDDALVGADADEDVVGRVHDADGDPERRREPDVEEIDLDVRDLELLGGGAGVLEGLRRQAVGVGSGGQGAKAEHCQESLAGQAHRSSSIVAGMSPSIL